MARLQILELPEGASDERAPFLLIIDQVDDELADEISRWPDDIAKRVGARHVLCFPGTVDIPANVVPLHMVTIDPPEPNASDVGEARLWARHGYEIGQRHCGWTDHGTAPAWLTNGWPLNIGACEHAKRAAEYDTKLALVRSLAADIEADAGQMPEVEAGNLRRIAGKLCEIVGDAYVVTEVDS